MKKRNIPTVRHPERSRASRIPLRFIDDSSTPLRSSDDVHWSSTLATAMALIPSPRPIAPSPSFVVALMLIASALYAERGSNFFLHRRDVRRNFRRFCQQSCVNVHDARILLRRNGCDMSQDFDAADPANRFVRVREMLPMSPAPSAPRMASAMAWERTSASECPSSPRWCEISTPPRMSLRPLTRQCAS